MSHAIGNSSHHPGRPTADSDLTEGRSPSSRSGDGSALPPGSTFGSWSVLVKSLAKSLARKPLWLAGLGLAGGWVVLEGTHALVSHMGDLIPLGLAAAGAGVWLTSRRAKPTAASVSPAQTGLSRSAVLALLGRAESILARLLAEQPALPDAVWRERLAAIATDLEAQHLRVVVAGGATVGKSALIAALKPVIAADWQETASLFTAESVSPDVAIAIQSGDRPGDRVTTGQAGQSFGPDLDLLRSADLVFLVLAGDLTAMELALLNDWRAIGVTPWVVFNKSDRFLPDHAATVVDHIRHLLADHGAAPSLTPQVLQVAAAPAPIEVRRHQTDGSVLVSIEQPGPDVGQIVQRFQAFQGQEAEQARYQRCQRQTEAVMADLLGQLAIGRRARALPFIEQSQWLTAAAAFANPVPALDLLAATAVNGQLAIDLAGIYGRSFSLDQARQIATTLAEVLLKLGLVEAGTQAIGAILKTNAATFVAGGIVQAISVAYLTRLAGLTLIEAFQAAAEAELLGTTHDTASWLTIDRLSTIARSVWQSGLDLGPAGDSLQTFVRQAIARLQPSLAA